MVCPVLLFSERQNHAHPLSAHGHLLPDDLPPESQGPEFVFDLPALRYPHRLNRAGVLLDGAVARHGRHRAAVYTSESTWSDADKIREPQNFVKQTVAPHKYPRSIDFVESLPRNPSGELRRFEVRGQWRAAR